MALIKYLNPSCQPRWDWIFNLSTKRIDSRNILFPHIAIVYVTVGLMGGPLLTCVVPWSGSLSMAMVTADQAQMSSPSPCFILLYGNTAWRITSLTKVYLVVGQIVPWLIQSSVTTLQVSRVCKADFMALSTEVHGSDMICCVFLYPFIDMCEYKRELITRERKHICCYC